MTHTWIEEEIEIKDVVKFLNDEYIIEAESPDGFVPIIDFVDKGDWKEYVLTLNDGRQISCNENHKFETPNGWKTAKDLINTECVYITDIGLQSGIVKCTGITIPIVDIHVDHPNHRYYTNGVSSHNTGAGKSLVMCHMAAANLSDGKDVLYITAEMSEEKIAERIDVNLMNVSFEDLELMPRDVFLKKVTRIRDKTPGKLVVKEYPASSAGASHFRHLLHELKIKKNFTPAIIYIDYLNICCSSRIKMSGSVNSYTYIKAIAEELRALATEFDVPIVSATQSNRDGANNSDVDITNISESFGLAATVDILLALISSDELVTLGQLMIKQLKNRYGDLNLHKSFMVGIDRSKMKLYNVEGSAQTLISDKPVMDSGAYSDGGGFNLNRNGKKNFSSLKIED